MAMAARRACFKCGNIGHYADNCSYSERLCYNCKQPGHESNACPQPRTTETKQCYHCSGLGHVQADCPTLRLRGSVPPGNCYNCGLPGHHVRNCPNRSINTQFVAVPSITSPPAWVSPRTPGSGGNATGITKCFKCGLPNHFARDCQAPSCFACGKIGHISKDCPSPAGGAVRPTGDKTCYRCGVVGHISKDCPQQPGSRPSPGVPTPRIPTEVQPPTGNHSSPNKPIDGGVGFVSDISNTSRGDQTGVDPSQEISTGAP